MWILLEAIRKNEPQIPSVRGISTKSTACFAMKIGQNSHSLWHLTETTAVLLFFVIHVQITYHVEVLRATGSYEGCALH